MLILCVRVPAYGVYCLLELQMILVYRFTICNISSFVFSHVTHPL